MTERGRWRTGLALAGVLGIAIGALSAGTFRGESDERGADGLGPASGGGRDPSTPPGAADKTGPVAPPGAPPPASLAGNPGGVDAEVHRLREENAKLEARLAEVEKVLAAVEARPGGPARAAKGPTFTFGEVGKMDAVRDADWDEMAESSTVVAAAVLEMMRRGEAGEAVTKDVSMRLQENVERMRRYEYRTIDRIPTAAKHNGELTHPVSVANLVAGVLARAGKPLSAAQVAEIERLGAEFETDFARTREGWGPGVVRARRMLEEYRLKGRFVDGLWAALTEEQRAAWIDPAFRGLAGVDLFDPTLMILHTSPVIVGESAAEIRAKLVGVLRPKVGLPADGPAPALERLADAFMGRLAATLVAVPKSRLRHYAYAEGLAAGEATVDLVEGLLRDVEMPAASRDALRDDFTWYVPRLLRR